MFVFKLAIILLTVLGNTMTLPCHYVGSSKMAKYP